MNPYETDELLGQYLDFHFGPGERFGVPNYPAACAQLCIAAHDDRPAERALDLGCAVGRTAFELARTFDGVHGVDLSARFIDAARTLRDTGRLAYTVPEEGDLVANRVADLSDTGLDRVAGRTTFEQADAARLPTPATPYDLVFAGNLIDRLAEPGHFLATVHEHLRPGGTLVIASPYTLLPEHTPRAQWIGGYHAADGTPVTVRDGLHRLLGERFDPVGEPRDQPFVIRETRRKFQHTVAEVTVWRRRID